MIDDIRKIERKREGRVLGGGGETPIAMGRTEREGRSIGQLIKIMSATESSREAPVYVRNGAGDRGGWWSQQSEHLKKSRRMERPEETKNEVEEEEDGGASWTGHSTPPSRC